MKSIAHSFTLSVVHSAVRSFFWKGYEGPLPEVAIEAGLRAARLGPTRMEAAIEKALVKHHPELLVEAQFRWDRVAAMSPAKRRAWVAERSASVETWKGTKAWKAAFISTLERLAREGVS